MNQVYLHAEKEGVQVKVFESDKGKAIQFYKIFSSGKITNSFTLKELFYLNRIFNHPKSYVIDNFFGGKIEPVKDKTTKIIEKGNLAKYNCGKIQLTYFANANEPEAKVKIVTAFHNGSEWKESNYVFEEDLPCFYDVLCTFITENPDKLMFWTDLPL